ncbi:MAG: hypothetical protein HY762_04465 [Planctomycetes bacterium]|nr:hypothetical protein [Planctomycetota bacterium]
MVIPESGPATGKRIRLGTPAYISPEQGRGDPDVDIRSDIYSLGVTFYYMVVGDAPFHGDSNTEVINKHIAEEPASPRSRNPAISNFANTIILKMMSKKREARYQTPAELLQDLDAVLAGRPLVIATMQPSKLRFAPRLSRATALARLKHKGINRLHLRRPLK